MQAPIVEAPARPQVGLLLHTIRIVSHLEQSGFEIKIRQAARRNQVTAEVFGRQSNPHGMDIIMSRLRKKLVTRWIPACAALVLLAGCATRGFPPQGGIQNADKVDAQLWRGAQPTTLGLEWLRSQGVQSIVNLRNDPLEFESQTCQKLGLTYTNIPWTGVVVPSVHQMESLRQTIHKLPIPVFVHCQYGCERTGSAVAYWRVTENGWTSGCAVTEALAFGMNPLWKPTLWLKLNGVKQ